jgi:uncharacterized protein YxeA
MKKMTQNQMQLILLLLIVIIMAGAYQFGYQNFNKKAQLVQAENEQIRQHITEMKQKQGQQANYEKGVAEAEEKIEEICVKYGPGNTPEKSIMILRAMEKQTKISISHISFVPDSLIYSSTKTKEDGTPEMLMYSTQVSVTFEVGYDGLKNCMDFINSYPERMNVESFNIVYDQETGKLKGAMIINLYSLVREGNTYTAPIVSGVNIGTKNIFKAK